MQIAKYETNAILSMVAQNMNVQLIPKSAEPTAKPIGISARAIELGPTIIAMEARGLSHGQIARTMSLSRPSISGYSGQYKRAVRDGLI